MNIISIVVLVMIAIAILGPDKLPTGLEYLWLNITNFLRANDGKKPLELEAAREQWRSQDSPVYTAVMLLRAATEHLLELRQRIFKVLIVMVVFVIAAIVGSNYLMAAITRPVGDVTLIALRPSEMFLLYVKVVLAAALTMTVPAIVYHLLRFIEPALESEKERAVYNTVTHWAIPFSGVFFLGGVAFAYFVMLPFSLKYLGEFGSQFAVAQWNVSEYVNFVVTLLLWIGGAFETPLIMFILAKAKIVQPGAFARARRWAYVGIAVLAAIITPTPDAINMLLVMAPLAFLYELGVFLAKLVK